MKDERAPEANQMIFADVNEFVREAAQRTQVARAEPPEPPLAYRIALGREVIQLEEVEFRILMLLASRPYRPFTRRRIAAEVTSETYPVTEDSVDKHIKTLRGQLSIFRDYIQSVPHIGYRFKQ